MVSGDMAPWHFRRALGSVATAIWLTACDTVPTVGVEQLIARLRPVAEVPESALQPQFSYLRASASGGRTAWLVLGEVEPTSPRSTEVWFSGDRQVLRLRDGRIVGAAGLPVDWVVSGPDPALSWRQVAEHGGGTYRRTRDTMPGYSIGHQEAVQIRPEASPPPGWVSRVHGAGSATWRWFTEDTTPLSPSSTGGSTIPRAWFAIDLNKQHVPVMASVQCLSADFCLDLQRRDRTR